MKLPTKLAVASLLALSAAAPALAVEPEALTSLERNTYLYTPDARPIVEHLQQTHPQLAGSEAFALVVPPHEGITDHNNPDNY